MWLDNYFNLLRQEEPTHMTEASNADEFAHILVYEFKDALNRLDIALYPLCVKKMESAHNTVAYVEEAYAEGWSAIINDGKLLGFRNEKVNEKAL